MTGIEITVIGIALALPFGILALVAGLCVQRVIANDGGRA